MSKRVNIFFIVSALLLTTMTGTITMGQNCTTCSGTNYNSTLGYSNIATGASGATAIGRESQALGSGSFATGYRSIGNGHVSTAMGYQSYAEEHAVAIGEFARSQAANSYTFGRYIRANASGSFVIGYSSAGYELQNGFLNSLMIGFNSIKPTVFVGPAPTVVGNNATGKVGIATTDPRQLLHVNGNILLTSANSSLLFADEAPATTNVNPFWGKWGIEYHAGGLNFWTPYQWTDIDSKISNPKAGDDVNFKLFLSDNGNVGIGTGTPLAKLHVSGMAFVDGKMFIGKFDAIPTIGTTNHSLYVKGGITTEEVLIKLQADWSDYVFEPDYYLPTLEELKEYISDNGHLPEVPTADQVEKEGFKVGEMNALLLKKVEELTLYILKQDERIKKLEGKISDTKN